MSDETIATSNEVSEPQRPGTNPIDVLMEQIDSKVAAIEKEQTRLPTMQGVVGAAKSDVTKLKEAAAASKQPDVASVYARAIELAEQIVDEVQEEGEEVVDQIEKMQSELRGLLDQLKAKDPNNPLIQVM